MFGITINLSFLDIAMVSEGNSLWGRALGYRRVFIVDPTGQSRLAAHLKLITEQFGLVQ